MRERRAAPATEEPRLICYSHRRRQSSTVEHPSVFLREVYSLPLISPPSLPCLMDHNYRSQPSKFALSGDAPNPLRPYYVPPSVGPPVNSPTIGPNTTSQPGLSNASKSSTSSTRPSFGTAARNILSDIDYGDYLKTPSSSSAPSSSSSLSSSSSSVAEAAKRLADQAIWKYTSVFLAQPFDVAKTILQCQHSGAVLRATGKSSYAQEITGGRFEGSEFGGNRETVSVRYGC